MDQSNRSMSNSWLLIPPATPHRHQRDGDGNDQANEEEEKQGDRDDNHTQQSYGTAATVLTPLTNSTRHASMVSLSRSLGSMASLSSSYRGSSSASTSRLKALLSPPPSRIVTTTEDQYSPDVDRIRIYRAIEEVGLAAFGIIAIDVWLIDSGGGNGTDFDGATLSHPKLQHDHHRGQLNHSVLWTNPTFCLQQPSEALGRLVDPTDPRYVPATPQVAGAGLAGYFLSQGSGTSHTEALNPHQEKNLHWRSLKAITSDPFQPPYERLRVLEEAGLGKATGILFDIPSMSGGSGVPTTKAASGMAASHHHHPSAHSSHHQGIVLFFARAEADDDLLNEPANVHLMKMAAQHVGTASALAQIRQASIAAKSKRTRNTFRRIQTNMSCVRAFIDRSPSYSIRSSKRGGSLRRDTQKSLSARYSPFPGRQRSTRAAGRKNQYWGSIGGYIGQQCSFVFQQLSFWIWLLVEEVQFRVLSVVDKSKGGSIRPPPSVPWVNTFWTFSGVFLTLCTLVNLSNLVSSALVLAPFGALLTLQYSLTAAPASQPRTIIYGQLICMGTVLLSHIILNFGMGWAKQSYLPLVVALGTALMTKSGTAHPPAAAAMVALLDSHHSDDFATLLVSASVLLLANMVAIGTAILINNLSEARHYPVYWEFGAGWPEMSQLRTRIQFRSCSRSLDHQSSNQENLPLTQKVSS